MEPEDISNEGAVSDAYMKESAVVIGFALLLLIILVAVFLFKDSPEEKVLPNDEEESMELLQEREQQGNTATQDQETELFIDPPRSDDDPVFSPDELIVQ